MAVAITFQQLIQRLNTYWAQQGCVLIQPLDLEVGAGTFHPATFLRTGPHQQSDRHPNTQLRQQPAQRLQVQPQQPSWTAS